MPYDRGARGHARKEERDAVSALMSKLALVLEEARSDHLQNVVLAVVLKFFRGGTVGPGDTATSIARRQRLHMEVVAASAVPGALVRLCSKVAAAQGGEGELDSVAHGAVFALAELTRDDAVTAAVVGSGALLALLPAIGNGRSPMFVGSVIEVFWNCLESGSAAAAIDELAGPDSAQTFAICFRRLLGASGAANKQVRNDVLTVVLLLLSGKIAPKLAQTTFLKDLMHGLTAPDLKRPERALPLNTGPEDFEFHRLGLIVVQKACSTAECLPAIERSQLMLLLFAYFPKAELSATTPLRPWTAPQLEELQLQSIATMTAIVQFLPTTYKRLRGSTQLLDLFMWCTQQPEVVPHSTGGARTFRGAGNSTYSDGDFFLQTETRPNNGRRAHGLLCVKVMYNLVSAVKDIRNDLLDQGVLEVLLKFLDRGALEEADQFDLAIRIEALNVLSVLCEDTPHVQELFGSRGVQILIEYLRVPPQYFDRGLGHAEACTAAVALVWSAVCGCELNENTFIELEGAFCLLDLLDRGPVGSTNLILGCLLDVCENGRALPCVIEWRSSVQLTVTAAHLLVRLWREAELAYDVHPEPTSYVAPDSEAPLMPLAWVPGADSGTISVDEVSDTLRAKIYSLLSKTGWESYPGLLPAERVTMETIRSYLTLKQGEIIQEIVASLEKDGVVPTEADQDYLDVAMDANRDRVTQLRELQADIILAHEARNNEELTKLYDEVELNHRPEKVAEEKRVDYLTRTTSHETLQAKAEEKARSVDQSRALCSPPHHTAIDHRADISTEKLNTTTFGKDVCLTGLLQPGSDGRELLAHETRGVLEDLPTTVLDV